MSNGIAGGDMAGTRGGDNVSIPRFILEDSPKLAKKIQQFEDLQRRASEAAATIGDVDDIANIKAQAQQSRDEADALMVHASSECERLITEAAESARQTLVHAESKAEEIIANAKKAAQAAATKMSEADAVMRESQQLAKAVAEAEKDVDAQANSLKQKADDLAGREQELTGEKARLAELRDLIQAKL